MPIYEYKCSACGKTFEHLLLNSQSAEKPSCPDCGNVKVNKIMSTPAILHESGTSGTTCCGSSERLPSCGSGGCCGR